MDPTLTHPLVCERGSLAPTLTYPLVCERGALAPTLAYPLVSERVALAPTSDVPFEITFEDFIPIPSLAQAFLELDKILQTAL